MACSCDGCKLDRTRAEAEVERLTTLVSSLDNQRAGLLETFNAEVKRLKARADAAEAEASRRFDCHGGPGTTEPACGACVTCVLRRAEAAEAKLAEREEWIKDAIAHEVDAKAIAEAEVERLTASAVTYRAAVEARQQHDAEILRAARAEVERLTLYAKNAGAKLDEAVDHAGGLGAEIERLTEQNRVHRATSEKGWRQEAEARLLLGETLGHERTALSERIRAFLAGEPGK